MSSKIEAGPTGHKDNNMTHQEISFRNFVSRDPNAPFPAETGRYALYLSPICPYAHRTLITRKLKGLESLIDVYELHHIMGPDGWAFNDQDGGLSEDPLHPGVKSMKELYLHANPGYTGRYTIPVLWDKKGDVMVNNESSEIMRMLAMEFDELLPEELRGEGLCPDEKRDAIDEVNEWVTRDINSGVYKVGFTKSNEASQAAIPPLFNALDRVETILGTQPYLVGDTLTEADIRLYTTIARFDAAYNPVLQCSLKTIRHDYPRLHDWLRRLYWDGGKFRGAFRETTEGLVGRYAEAYADGRRRVVWEGFGPLIIPVLPAVGILIPPFEGA